MPLRDRDRTKPRRLVRLGVIRLGHKEKRRTKQGREYEYPVQDDHFVLSDAPEIAQVYGDTPRELDVILPFPDVWRNFDAAYTVWAGGVLVCRGDGEFVDYATPHQIAKKKLRNGGERTSVRNAPGETLVVNGTAQVAFEWNGESFQTGDQVPCPGAKADAYPHCAACKASAVLKVMMAKPELFRLGFYQVSTGSGRNYDTILGTLELVYQSAGRVSGIPFKLRLVKEPTSYLGNDGTRRATEKWFLQLEPEPTFTRQLYANQARAALHALPEPVSQDDAPEFDEVDEAAPPPFAEENIDPVTGEIFDDLDDVEWIDDIGPDWDSVPGQDAADGGPGQPEVETGATASAAKNTNGATRPLQPAVVKEFLHQKARAGGSGPATKKQIPFLASKFQEAFAGDSEPDRKYHSCLLWLWGTDSAKNLTLGQAKATLDWLLAQSGPDDSGDIPLHEHAPEEAQRVLRAAMKDAGQSDMFNTDEENEVP